MGTGWDGVRCGAVRWDGGAATGDLEAPEASRQAGSPARPPLGSPPAAEPLSRRCRGGLPLPAPPRGRQAGRGGRAGFRPSRDADGEVRGSVSFPPLGMKWESSEDQERFE